MLAWGETRKNITPKIGPKSALRKKKERESCTLSKKNDPLSGGGKEKNLSKILKFTKTVKRGIQVTSSPWGSGRQLKAAKPRGNVREKVRVKPFA